MELSSKQDRQISRLFEACRHSGHELLLEIIASKHGLILPDTVAQIINHIYDLGVFPDWWKLEPVAEAQAWSAIENVIEARDPRCRGIVLLGLAASEDDLLASFSAAVACRLVRGFAVGRTIWQAPAAAWLKGEIDDESAVTELASNFSVLVEGWRAARRKHAA